MASKVGVNVQDPKVTPTVLRQLRATVLDNPPEGETLIEDVAPKIDPKSRISPQKVPATLDASQIYLNLMYAAGTETAPG
jgi:hypothetical protein